MISEKQTFMWSDRFYTGLLFLYPVEFRVRFGKEMAQVFRDCCRDQVRTGTLTGIGRLWLRALLDLALSIPRERGRALLHARGLPMRTGSLIDSIVILAIIGFHLLVAGTFIASYVPRSSESSIDFLVVAATAGTALGGLGVICSLVLARFRRIHYRFIEL